MYQIEDVFSPKSFPKNTYVMRKSDEYETIDDRFRKALAMKGNLIFISGASKPGKTVCSSYVGEFATIFSTCLHLIRTLFCNKRWSKVQIYIKR